VEVVIFDLDGTLAYTASSHRKAWELALKDLGLQIPENLDDLLGRRTIEIAKQLGGRNIGSSSRGRTSITPC
jgi:Predicted phosphatase/phosphohexomutase